MERVLGYPLGHIIMIYEDFIGQVCSLVQSVELELIGKSDFN